MVRGPIELVVTDLDGTLWTNNGDVDPPTRAALAELDRLGVPILVATGRRLRSARTALAKPQLDHLPCVGLNGALGADPESLFHTAALSATAAAAIYQAFVNHDVRPVGYTAPPHYGHGIDCIAEEGVSTHPDHLAVLEPSLVIGDVLAAELVAMSVLGLPAERLLPIRDAVVAADAGDCVLSRDHAYGEYNLAVTARGVSKWTGVLAYCAHQSIDSSRVLAIGNDDNDVVMLQLAAVGLAIAGSPASVSDNADATVRSWAELLDYI